MRDYDDEEDPDTFVTCTEKYSAYLIAILTVVVLAIMILLLNSVAPTFCNPNDLACSKKESEERMYSDYDDADDYPVKNRYKQNENVPPDVNEKLGKNAEEDSADNNEVYPPRPTNGPNSDEINPETQELPETTDDGNWSDFIDQNPEVGVDVHHPLPPYNRPHEVHLPYPPNEQNSPDINPETQELTETTDDGDWSDFIDQNPEVGVDVHHPLPPYNRPHEVHLPYPPNEQNSPDINPETQESTETIDEYGDYVWSMAYGGPPNRQDSDEINPETQESTETTNDGEHVKSNPTRENSDEQTVGKNDLPTNTDTVQESPAVPNLEARAEQRGFLRRIPPYRQSYFPYPYYDDYPLMGQQNRPIPSNSARHGQRPVSRRLNPHRNWVVNPRKPILTQKPPYGDPDFADILDKLSLSEIKLIKDLIKNKRRNR